MNWGKLFRGIWKGAQIVANIGSVFLTGIPLSSRAALIIGTIFEAIHFAEENWPNAGSGLEKFNFVMSMSLTALEQTTGRNVNNPKTRALLEECINLYVQIMNLVGQLRQAVKDLQGAIDSVKDPAIPDAP